jgi:hypothetical protein
VTAPLVYAPPPASSPPRRRPGWWRSNWWGLLAVVPAAVLALWSPTHDAYETFHRYSHEPVNSTPGGWVTYAGAKMRVTAMGPADDLKKFDGTPAQLRGGIRAWKVTIEFQTSKPDSIGSCAIFLEDSAGATYEPAPAELADYDLPFSASCLPDLLATPSPTFQTVAYFVMPGTARPAAIQVKIITEEPKYARLLPP